MKVVLAILAFWAMFAMFCAGDNKERRLYTVAYIATIVGMVGILVLEWVALWNR